MSETLEVMPPDSKMGSDGRPHHEYGFSFVATIEKCAAARRSESAATSIKSAGERGTELHRILQFLVEDWAAFVERGPAKQLDQIPWRNVPHGDPAFGAGKAPKPILSTADTAAINKVIAELKPFFVPEPGMLLGTEERIDLHDGEGNVVSFGYYDLFLKLGRTILIIDHKFVRKEVEAAERNRQGHCLAVSVWQAYQDCDDVVILFTMPDCGSSIYRFNRTTDELRLFNELMMIFQRRDHPLKVLQAGDHCVYCRYRMKCDAAIGTLKTLVTGIEPLAVPASFAPQLITTAEDMAVLRYWADTCQIVIDAIKEKSLEWAQAQQGIAADINGQHVEYAVQSRAFPRKLGPAFEIWKEISPWLPVEAFISACDTSVTNLNQVVVAYLSDRLLQEGKEPNASKLEADFTAMLMEKGLLTKEEGRTFFLKRVKASAKKRKKRGVEQELDALPEGDPEPAAALSPTPATP
jgi:Protein of unknown function (DUF2800)